MQPDPDVVIAKNTFRETEVYGSEQWAAVNNGHLTNEFIRCAVVDSRGGYLEVNNHYAAATVWNALYLSYYLI